MDVSGRMWLWLGRDRPWVCLGVGRGGTWMWLEVGVEHGYSCG